MTNDFKLLYVEDNKVVRENFVEIFSRYFKNITTADNGKTALELYNNNDFNIAILDISIPEISGLSLAKKIRERDSESDYSRHIYLLDTRRPRHMYSYRPCRVYAEIPHASARLSIIRPYCRVRYAVPLRSAAGSMPPSPSDIRIPHLETS